MIVFINAIVITMGGTIVFDRILLVEGSYSQSVGSKVVLVLEGAMYDDSNFGRSAIKHGVLFCV